MATRTNSGFTIIETLLYLGVSSALMAAIILGVGSSVTQQRYRDSVDSLKSMIQEQYGVVANTVNNRPDVGSCRLQGSSIAINNSAAPGVDPTLRGASECVIIGRYIESVASSNGTRLYASDVIAHPKSGGPGDSATNDVTDLSGNYHLTRGTYERQQYDLAWSGRIVDESSTTAKVFSIMIVRSPRSGGIMTFSAPGSSTGNPISTTGLVSQASNARTLNLCVDGDRGMGLGAKLRQVRVAPYATSPSAVQVPNESDSTCA